MSGILNNLYSNVSYALALHSQDMLRLQEETATGSRINRMSDDPSLAHRVLVLESKNSSQKNYIDNLNTVLNTFEVTASTIQSMNDELIKTKELITQVAGGIYGENNRQRIADGINDHLEQMVQLANSQHANEYLFAGDKTTTAPYTVTRDSDGNITAVTYQGSDNKRTVETAPGVDTGIFHVGTEIFNSSNRSTPTFPLEATDASLGSGTPNVTGDNWLTVTHNGTSYELSLNGHTAVDVAGASDSSNVAVTDANGKVLYVNADTITSTGTELVRVPGTYNVFDTLISTRDILNNTQSLPDHQLTTAMQSAADAVSEVSELILQTDVSVGLTTGFLYDLQTTLENAQANSEEESGSLSEVDIAQVAIDLSRRQVLYEMSLSVAGKLMQISLLNFLR